MLDTSAIERMVEEQIKIAVNSQVLEVLTSDDWVVPLEQKIIKYTQDRILGKFANAGAVPEIIDAVKNSVTDLFAQGKIPGIDQYIDQDNIKQSIDLAVEQLIEISIGQLVSDPLWLEKIERMINQTITQRTVSTLSKIDINPLVQSRVDENMSKFKQEILTKFSSTGIDDQATSCQLTVMDDVTVIENNLTTKDLEVVGTAVIRDLAVKGTININNPSWQFLADAVTQKTLASINQQWQDQLVDQVKQKISEAGINFETINVGDSPLISGSVLSSAITESRLHTVGQLKELTVKGPAKLYDTVHVVNKRLGVNTDTPEMALSVWDEEVSVVIGKNKAKQAYVGTNRDQSLVIGVNRSGQIEIDTNGLTTIKQLRVGLHKIAHDTQVPGWSGTRGDLVFNSNPGADRVFAWMCLGGHRWQTLKSAE